MNVIKVENLVKKYKKAEKNAVDGISFYVEKGSFFSLLGPNGAGKTTTMAILTTTLAKTSGKVVITGHDLDVDQSSIRKNCGVIFQNPSLDLNLTAEENVRLHTVLYGIYPFRPTYSLMPTAYKNKVKELSEVLGINEDIHKPIKTFSGGMKRKLEIVRSLTHNPKVLFLDEPTTGLDPVSRKNLWTYLKQIRKEHDMTIFLTTHYLEEAEESDYVCVINHGEIVSQGSPQKIKKDLIEDYISVFAKNKKQLIDELNKSKLHFKEMDKGVIKIFLRGKTAHEVIKNIETPLADLSVHTPTLEEAYLEIIQRHDEHI